MKTLEEKISDFCDDFRISTNIIECDVKSFKIALLEFIKKEEKEAFEKGLAYDGDY